jgi:hypothetical protein
LSEHDERTLGRLLRALRPAPEDWVQAAKELPQVAAELDGILARAEADARFREELIADLEATLAREGYAPDERLLGCLERRLRPGASGNGAPGP